MKGTEIVYEIMKQKGITMAILAEKLGYTTISGVSGRLYNKHDMRADSLADFLDVLDCDLVIRSRLKDKQEWVISGSSDKE